MRSKVLLTNISLCMEEESGGFLLKVGQHLMIPIDNKLASEIITSKRNQLRRDSDQILYRLELLERFDKEKEVRES